jgi:hypothetical protein
MSLDRRARAFIARSKPHIVERFEGRSARILEAGSTRLLILNCFAVIVTFCNWRTITGATSLKERVRLDDHEWTTGSSLPCLPRTLSLSLLFALSLELRRDSIPTNRSHLSRSSTLNRARSHAAPQECGNTNSPASTCYWCHARFAADT